MTKHARWCRKEAWRRLLTFRDRYFKRAISREDAESVDTNAKYMPAAFETERYGDGRVVVTVKSKPWLAWLIGKGFDVSKEVFFEYSMDKDEYLFWQSPNDDLLNQLIEEQVLPSNYGE